MKHLRPSWDDYFMEIATVVAKRSTCLRRQVGAILVRDRRILSTGYNGAPSGLAHCLIIGCKREQEQIPSGQRHEICRAVHAEQNAIIQAALAGSSIEGAVCYTTLFPCSLCAKLLINSHIKAIYYGEGYPDELSMELLTEAKIPMYRIPADNTETPA